MTQSTAGWILGRMVLVVLLALGFVYRGQLEYWIFRRADHGKAPGRFDGGSGRENWR